MGTIGEMLISTVRTAPEQAQADALIVPVFEGRPEERFGAGGLAEAGEVSGKAAELTLLHHPPATAATRVLLAGAGKPEKFGPAEMRKLAGAAVRHLKGKSIRKIALALEGNWATAENAAAAVEGAILGDFETDRHKPTSELKRAESFTVVAPPEAAGIDEGVTRADGSWPRPRTTPASWPTSRPTA